MCFEGENGKGSGRSLPGFDLYDVLAQSKDYLKKYGGHEMAVGLVVEKEHFEEFKQKFEEIAANKKISETVPVINIDSSITHKDINKEIMEELNNLEPFGESNRTPIFSYKNLKIDSIRALSEGRHLKMVLRDENYLINAIGFNKGHFVEEYLIGDKIDIVGNLEINNYNGEETIQFNLQDVMKSV